MTKLNPTKLEYDALEPGNAPKYGVSMSPSYDFKTGARYVLAWFVNLGDAQAFAKLSHPAYRIVWDLEEARIIP